MIGGNGMDNLNPLSGGDQIRLNNLFNQATGVGDFSLGGFVGPQISNPMLSSLYDSGFFNQQISDGIQNQLNSTNPFAANVQEWLKYSGQPVNTSDVTQNGNVIGSINNDLINDALKNLPITGGNGTDVVSSGQGQVTQTGGGNPANNGSVGSTGQGTVGDGSGQVPPPPTTNTGGGNGGGFDIFDIFNVLGGGSGSGATPPFNSNGGDMTYDDLANLPIFGGGGSGGSATATGGSNFLSDLFGDITGSLSNAFGDIGNTVLNAGVSNYAADQQRNANKDALDFYGGIYQGQIDRLEPFRQSGLGAIPGLEGAANSNPQYRDLFAGQQQIDPMTNVQRNYQGNQLNPNVSYNAPQITSTQGLPALEAGNRNVQLGDSSQVGVNQINPLDRNDPYLRFLQDEQSDVVQNSAAANGKLQSGGTLTDLQDRAANVASNYMGQIQNISSAQDQARLASQGQSFGQQTTNAGLNNQLNQQQLQNASGVRGQLFGEGTTQFGQGLGLAGLDLGAQAQQFGQGLNLNNQNFSQDLSGAAFDLGQQQNNIQNQFGLNNMLFGQNLGANQFSLADDQNSYNQLYDLTRLGQNSAASQGAGSASFGNTGADILSQNGLLSSANTVNQGQNIGNFLAGLFS